MLLLYEGKNTGKGMVGNKGIHIINVFLCKDRIPSMAVKPTTTD